jgi:hypothetical protein
VTARRTSTPNLATNQSKIAAYIGLSTVFGVGAAAAAAAAEAAEAAIDLSVNHC